MIIDGQEYIILKTWQDGVYRLKSLTGEIINVYYL